MQYTNVTFTSSKGSGGVGLVASFEDEKGLHLIEKGRTTVNYHNHLTLKKKGDGYHLSRYDLQLELFPEGSHFVSKEPYRCGEDLYSASLSFIGDEMHLSYGIQGPNKDEQVRFHFYQLKLPDYHIETERLELKPFTPEGEAFFLHMLQDPSADNIMGIMSHEQAEKKLATYMQGYQNWGYGLTPIFRKGEETFIGYGGICHLAHDDRDPELEIGYHLRPKFRGQGYATELAKELVSYGFDVLKAPYLVGIVNHDNQTSQRVLEKVGFRKVGETIYRGKPVLRFELI